MKFKIQKIKKKPKKILTGRTDENFLFASI